MSEREPSQADEGGGSLGEFTEEAKEVYSRLLRDAVTVRSVMARRVADDSVGRRFDAGTRDSLAEMLARAARQRDEPST